MAEADGERLSPENVTVFDVDSHVDESLDDVLPYVESSGVKRTIESAENPRREIFTSTRPTPAFPTTEGVKSRTADLEDAREIEDTVHARGANPNVKRQYMDEYHVDYALASTQQFGLATVNHDLIATEIASAYNEWMASEYLPECDTDRIKGSLLVAQQRPNEAAAEIEKWGDDEGFAAVQFPAAGLRPPAGHHWHDPIFEAAEKRDLPLVLHSGSTGGTETFPIQRSWARNFTEAHNLLFPLESMWHLNSMIFRGLPERYPDLKIVIVESGVEWVPWYKWRADDHYLQNAWDVPLLDKLPSEYIADHFYFTTMPLGHTQDLNAFANVVDAAGAASNVMFASDHPHPDIDLPYELSNSLTNRLDDETVRKVMGETALSVFDFE